jgi:hypothetical protein
MLESGDRETWKVSERIGEKKERRGERGKKGEREKQIYEPVQER